MSRPRKQSEPDRYVVEFRNPGAKRSNSSIDGRWSRILEPLLKHPGRWAMIYTAENPEQAWDTQSNLAGRKVIIPNPQHEWAFVSRGCEVFAIYRGGPKRGRVRRTKRQG